MNTPSKLCASALAAGTLMLLSGCSGSPDQTAGPTAAISSDATTATATTAQQPSSRTPAPTGAAAAATAPPAASATTPVDADADVDAQITNVLGGDPKAYHAVFDKLQKAMAAGDKAGVAALVAYPLEATIEGRKQKIANAQALVANWNRIMTPEITQAVANQKFSDVMVNQDGLMIGDGQVWISGICQDRACSTSTVKVTTIQPVAR